MKKILLLCAIVCASQLYGMEPLYQYCANVITHSYSYISSFFVTPESNLLRELRKDKDEFERALRVDMANKLHLSPGNYPYGYLEEYASLFVSPKSVLYPPMNFLHYCYYLKFKHEVKTFASWMKKIDADSTSKDPNSHLLDEVKKIVINGYSAIGAAILAPDVSIESKRKFIQQLFDLGFKPTKKDIMLAELALYDAIPESAKENILLFLQQEDLVPDIKRNIISCLIEQYRAKYWPLPENVD